MLKLGVEAGQAGWVHSTYITPDTEALNARADRLLIEAMARFAKEAARSIRSPCRPTSAASSTCSSSRSSKSRRRIRQKRRSSPSSRRASRATYGRGKWCKDPAKPDTCLDIEKITEILATSRDPKQLREAWEGWHTVSRADAQGLHALRRAGQQGRARSWASPTPARCGGSKYDMPADEFTKEVDRLWEQVRPLYVSLHAYVRMKLHEKYGDAVPASGPIPAHLLGNIWAQDWSNVFDLVAPGTAESRLLAERHPEAPQDHAGRHGEDGRAVLHVARLRAAAEDVLGAVALRQAGRSRRRLPRERVETSTTPTTCASRCASTRPTRTSRRSTTSSGTTSTSAPTRSSRSSSATAPTRRSTRRSATPIALSVTPEYLVQDRLARQGAGRLARSRPADVARAREDRVPAVRPADRSVALGCVLRQGRARRLQQGVVGAAAEVSGRRAAVAERRAVLRPRRASTTCRRTTRTRATSSRTSCSSSSIASSSKIAGCTTPLHRCSIYESKEAGKRLDAMLKMGASSPWPDALEALTGSRQMDATAIVDYFAPLKTWLDEQLEGQADRAGSGSRGTGSKSLSRPSMSRSIIRAIASASPAARRLPTPRVSRRCRSTSTSVGVARTRRPAGASLTPASPMPMRARELRLPRRASAPPATTTAARPCRRTRPAA